MNSTEGQDFLDQLIEQNPGLFGYAFNATNDAIYDFKVRGETDNMTREQRQQHRYRGSVASDGSIGSARDYGNIGAGIVAGRKNIAWSSARRAFDAYQMITDKLDGRKPSREGPTTQKAQQVGYKMGQKLRPAIPMRKP